VAISAAVWPAMLRSMNLGKISPKEFAQFIGKMLAHGLRVEYTPRVESTAKANSCVGKVRPARRPHLDEANRAEGEILLAGLCLLLEFNLISQDHHGSRHGAG